MHKRPDPNKVVAELKGLVERNDHLIKAARKAISDLDKFLARQNHTSDSGQRRSSRKQD